MIVNNCATIFSGSGEWRQTATMTQAGKDSDQYGGPQDRYPPPSWGGAKPDVTFNKDLEDVKLWRLYTDISMKQGIKMVQALPGAARVAVDEIDV